MKTIAFESVDFFQRKWNCLEKHEDLHSMSRVVKEHKLLTIGFLMIIKQDGLSTLPLKMERAISKMVLIKLILLLIPLQLM